MTDLEDFGMALCVGHLSQNVQFGQSHGGIYALPARAFGAYHPTSAATAMLAAIRHAVGQVCSQYLSKTLADLWQRRPTLHIADSLV